MERLNALLDNIEFEENVHEMRDNQIDHLLGSYCLDNFYRWRKLVLIEEKTRRALGYYSEAPKPLDDEGYGKITK